MFVVTGVALAVSFALGVSAHLGLVPGRLRSLHHVAFFAVAVAAGLTFVVDVYRGSWRALPIGAMVVVLAVLPRTHGGSRRHVGVALLTAAAYGAAALTGSGA